MANVQLVPLSSYDWSLGNFELLQWNPTVYCLVASFFAVSLWLALELSVQVYFTFRRHRGLYFWSILVVTLGITLHTIGFILKLLVPGVNVYLSTVLAKVGWICDTTGFAVVLYSRLHLLVDSSRTLKLVLGMIIADAIIFHTPMIVFLMGLSTSSHENWAQYVNPFEYTQVVGFSIQETIISGIYIRKTAKYLKTGYSTQLRKVMTLLITVQVLVVLMDITLIVIDCIGMFTLKAILHPFAYAIKLKIEFAVLNLLLNMVKHDRTIGEFFPPLSNDSSSTSTTTTIRGRQPSNTPTWQWPQFLTFKQRKDTDGLLPLPNINTVIKTMAFNVVWQDSTRNNSRAIVSDDAVLQKPASTILPSKMTKFDSGSTLRGDVSDGGQQNSIEDVERQYLGNFGLHRPPR